MKSVEDLPSEERPREKLCLNGPRQLTDRELIAVALGSGNREENVFSLSEKVLTVIDQKNGNLQVSDLLAVKGIGSAKAALITAMIEFARRRIRPEGVSIKTAADVVPLIKHLADRRQECFVVISLNGAHEVIAVRVVTVGLVNAAQVHPREVFSDPICDRACSVVVAHNHPSGELVPSREDINVTKRLEDAAKTLGITLLDHIIFSRRGFVSLREQGLI